jgi:hypothetical protein
MLNELGKVLVEYVISVTASFIRIRPIASRSLATPMFNDAQPKSLFRSLPMRVGYPLVLSALVLIPAQ